MDSSNVSSESNEATELKWMAEDNHEVIEFRIPDKFYELAEPYITEYLGNPNAGIRYKIDGEQAIEMQSVIGGDVNNQWLTVSLLSPIVSGIRGLAGAEIMDVNLEARTVKVKK